MRSFYWLALTGGVILTSPDGAHWVARGSGTANGLNGVTWGNGLLVAVGTLGTLLTSESGADWSAHDVGIVDWLSDAAYGPGSFVVVGYGGRILQRESVVRIASLQFLPGKLVEITVSGWPGQANTIQVSNNGENWVTLTNLVMGAERTQCYDSAPGNGTLRLYRAVVKY